MSFLSVTAENLPHMIILKILNMMKSGISKKRRIEIYLLKYMKNDRGGDENRPVQTRPDSVPDNQKG